MRSAAALLLSLLVAQAAPRDNSAPRPWGPIDNQRVHVWLDDGSAATYQGKTVGRVRIAEADGRASYSTDASISDRAAGSGARTVEIDLKDAMVAPLANVSGYPLAFPRPGVKKILENDRVIVWDYTWTAGVPTPMHFHDKDVIVVYLADGALRSTDPAGATVVNPHYDGFTKFNPRNRVHTEQLVQGKARAVIVELK